MKQKSAITLAFAGMLGIAAAAFAAEQIALSVGNFRPMEAETSKYLTPVKHQSLEDS